MYLDLLEYLVYIYVFDHIYLYFKGIYPLTL
jgi:hypothetical protein